jgi:hypothetical protein
MRFGEIFKDGMLGSTRIITKFLWLPVTIDFQIRWLEWANIKQMCRRTVGGEVSDDGYYWQNIEWIDENKGAEN